MIYRKNLYSWEQLLRIAAGIGLSVFPFLSGGASPLLWIVGGLSLALTGVFGFCPACYAVGRKTPNFQSSPSIQE